jgi:hypothetical protein
LSTQKPSGFAFFNNETSVISNKPPKQQNV